MATHASSGNMQMEVMEQLDMQVPVPVQSEGSTSQNLQSWFIGNRLGIPAGIFR